MEENKNEGLTQQFVNQPTNINNAVPTPAPAEGQIVNPVSTALEVPAEPVQQVLLDEQPEELIMDDILAQQPLMASLQVEDTLPPTGPNANEETSSSQTEDESLMQNAIANSTLVMNGEKTLEEVNAMNAAPVDNNAPAVVPEVVPQVVNQPTPEDNKPKKKIVGKIITAIILLAVLGVGGYFGYKTFFGGVNLNAKAINDVEEAKEYIEKELKITLEKEEEPYSGRDAKYSYKNDSMEVSLIGDEDNKIKKVYYKEENADLKKSYSKMSPFLKNYSEDTKFLKAALDMVQEYGTFAKVDLVNNFAVSNEDNTVIITLGFGKPISDKEPDYKIDYLNKNTMVYEINDAKLKVGIKKKYGKYDITRVEQFSSIIFISAKKEDEFDISVLNSDGKLSEYDSESGVEVIKREKKAYNGIDGYLVLSKSEEGGKVSYKWSYLIPTDFSSIDEEAEKDYFIIMVSSLENDDKPFEELMKDVKKG